MQKFAFYLCPYTDKSVSQSDFFFSPKVKVFRKKKKKGIDSSGLGWHLETMEGAACSLTRNILMEEIY